MRIALALGLLILLPAPSRAQGTAPPVYVPEVAIFGNTCVTIYGSSGLPICSTPNVGCYLAENVPTTSSTFCATATNPFTFATSHEERWHPGPPPTSTDLWILDARTTTQTHMTGVFAARLADFLTIDVGVDSENSFAPPLATYLYAEQRDFLPNPVTSFFLPDPSQGHGAGSPDLDIFVTAAGAVTARYHATTSGSYEGVLGERYVTSYHPTALAAGGQNIGGLSLARLAPGTHLTTQTLDFEMSALHDAEIGPTWNTTWDDYENVTLRFPAGRRLVVRGSLTADSTTLTASNPTAGWAGISVEGGVAVLDGVLVEHANFAGQDLGTPMSAVTVSGGGLLTLRNGAVVTGTVNGQGVGAVGGTPVEIGTGELYVPSRLILEGDETRVWANELGGVVAQGGAVATIQDRATVDQNPGGGVIAGGYGTVVNLDHASVLENDGPGVTATGGALVRTTAPASGTLRTSVNNNAGGLSAVDAGSVQMGACKGGSACTNAGHAIQLNSPNGAFFDAQAFGGSAVRAQGNDWGVPDVGCLDLQQDGSSTLTIAPLLPSGSPCGVITERTGALPAGMAGRSHEPQSSRGMSDDVLALVVDAEDALAGDDETGAVAAIRRALALADTDDDRAGAFAGAARLLTRASLPAVVAALDSAAATPARAFALGALAVGYASAGQTTDADVAAAALASEYGETAHVALALGVRTRLAAEAGAEASALSHLGALYAVAPASSAFTTAASIVAAVFPEADLPGALRSGGPVEDALAAKTGDADGAPGWSLLSVAVWPNPSVGASRVRVAVPSSEGTLDVSVYDALGRQVATLAEGTLAGSGAFDADVPALPAGVYLVRAAHRTGDGRTSVAVARLTVVR